MTSLKSSILFFPKITLKLFSLRNPFLAARARASLFADSKVVFCEFFRVVVCNGFLEKKRKKEIDIGAIKRMNSYSNSIKCEISDDVSNDSGISSNSSSNTVKSNVKNELENVELEIAAENQRENEAYEKANAKKLKEYGAQETFKNLQILLERSAVYSELILARLQKEKEEKLKLDAKLQKSQQAKEEKEKRKLEEKEEKVEVKF